MANERVVSLLLDAQTAGGDKIRELAAEVDKLAAEGGAAAPEFKKLADELKKLEQQQGVIAQFTELSRKSTETKVAFEQMAAATRASVAAVEDRKTALAAAATAEKASSDAIQKHRDTLEAARNSLAQVKAELASYKAAIALSGKATDEQTKAIAAAKVQAAQYGSAIAAAKAAIAQATPAQRDSAAAVTAASNALKQASSDLSRNQAATSAARAEYERTATSVQKTAEQMDRLGMSTRNLGASQQQVTQGFQRASQEVDHLRDKAGQAGGGFSLLTNFVRGAAGQITTLVGAVAGLQEFVRVNVELENVNRTLTVLTGSSKAAAAEMDFIKGVSNRLGLELIETSKSYAQFAAATKGTALEGEQTRKIFESVSSAMSVAGRSSAEASAALNALGQMVSKGTVQMEELRGQLGDRLPGALKLAADGMGLTTSQLVKMVSDGKVLAVDLLPKLADALNNTYQAGANAGSTLQQDWNRFKNSISETSKEMGESGILRSMLELGRVVGVVTAGFGNMVSIAGTLIGSTFGVLFQQVSDLGSAIANLSFDGFMQKSRNAAQVLRDTMRDELDRAATSIRRFTEQSAIMQGALNLIGMGSEKAAASVDKTATAAAKSAAAAQQAGLSWVKLTSIYGELTTQTEKAIQTAEKSVAARKAEGETTLTMAKAFGTEIEQRKAATDAATGNQAALEELARQRTAELSLMQAELASMKEWMAQNKDETKERQETIKTLEQKIAARKEETDKAIAQAQAARLATEAAKTEQATHADNSARLAELRDAYASATVECDRLRAARAAGLDVAEKLKNAELNAAKAATMYRDALSDQQKVLSAGMELKRVQNTVAEAALRLQLEEVNRTAEVARAKGDESTVRKMAIEQRRLEIELAKLQAKMMRAEAEYILENTKLTRENLKAHGELTQVKELELKREEAAAKLKLKQAEITDVQIKKLEELKQIQDGVAGGVVEYTRLSEQAADGTRRLSDEVDGLATRLERAAASAERLAEGVKKVGGGYVNKEGFASDAQGNTISMKGIPDPWKHPFEDIWYFTDAQGKLRRSNSQPIYKDGRWMSPEDVGRMIGPAPVPGPTSWNEREAPAQATPGTTAPANRSTTHTVNINLNGRSTSFNAASEQDANRAADFLSLLEKDMMRSVQ